MNQPEEYSYLEKYTKPNEYLFTNNEESVVYYDDTIY